jgi:hypothetical protein
MPKGEKVLAQSKRTAPPIYQFQKYVQMMKFFNSSIDILLYSKGEESSIFKIDILKPSRTLRGGFY